MKNPGMYLVVISAVLGITSCEKSLESRFDMSAIPGLYFGQVEVLASDSSMCEKYGEVFWGTVRLIPENYNYSNTYSIQEVNNNLYTLTFLISDTILPDKITFEISRFEEQYSDVTDAYIKLMENDLWQLSRVFDFGMGNAINNQIRYFGQDWTTELSFDFVLKRKDRDDFILSCSGFRNHI